MIDHGTQQAELTVAPLDVRVLDADAVVRELVLQRAASNAAQATELLLAAHFVALHPVTDDEDAPLLDRVAATDRGPALDDGSGTGLGGPGTPAVAERAVEALGAALGVPYRTALRLLSESVALCYRFPRLWARVQTGQLPAWQARVVARSTRVLSVASADFVDRQLTICCDRRRWPSLRKLDELLHEARLRDDPDYERGVEEAALTGTGVWFDHRTSQGTATTTEMLATLDAYDAFELDATISDLANTMGRLGDTGSHDQRRAQALTLLGNPQALLDLQTAAATDTAGTAGGDEASGTSCATPAPSPQSDTATGRATSTRSEKGRSSMVLYVHATLTELAQAGLAAASESLTPPTTDRDQPFCDGVVLVERFGAALDGVVARWARRTDRLIVRPVLDPTSVLPDRDSTATRPVDQHDPPEPMREHVVLRDGQCVFPGCTTDARSCDLDHIDPYIPLDEGGPPGQTHPGNLACLCRRHHRLKTHTSWDYERDPDGTCSWTDPPGATCTTYPLPRRAPRR